VFEGPDGSETLADLFAGRSQLIVQHFMFGPSRPVNFVFLPEFHKGTRDIYLGKRMGNFVKCFLKHGNRLKPY